MPFPTAAVYPYSPSARLRQRCPSWLGLPRGGPPLFSSPSGKTFRSIDLLSLGAMRAPIQSVGQPLFSCPRASNARSPCRLLLLRLRQVALTPSRRSRLAVPVPVEISSQGRCHAVFRSQSRRSSSPSPFIFGLRRSRSVCICLTWPGSALNP